MFLKTRADIFCLFSWTDQGSHRCNRVNVPRPKSYKEDGLIDVMASFILARTDGEHLSFRRARHFTKLTGHASANASTNSTRDAAGKNPA